MRIGMLLDTNFPPDSRVENEAVTLIKAGHKVHLFALNYFQRLPARETINGIFVHRYALGKLAYKLSALVYTVPFFRMLVQSKIQHFIKSNKIERLHIHDMPLGKAGLLAAKKHNIGTVLDLHENRPEIMKHYRHVNTTIGKLTIWPQKWKSMQNWLANRADSIIVVTEEGKEQLAEAAKVDPKKISVVPNSIRTDIFLNYPIDGDIQNSLPKGFRVLYVGDTGLRRGTGSAIQAISILKTKIPRIHLLLVGSNNEDVHLKNLVHELSIEDSVTFFGWQDISLFPTYISSSDIGISPLKRNAHHDTTYANKIFQYMAMGLPVVVSDCPAQKRVIESCSSGLVHKAEDAQDLADKIFELYENSEKRKQFGTNGMEAILKDWHWEKLSKELVILYQ